MGHGHGHYGHGYHYGRGHHFSHARHWYHGRWWYYGVGSCWQWSDDYDEYVWVCS
jgi:hypothetical protein